MYHSEIEGGSEREIFERHFDKEELDSANFKLVDDYYNQYHKFTTNPTYARRMIRVLGDKEDQFRVDMQHLFEEEGNYKAKELNEKINKMYEEYGAKRKAKPTDLIEFGYKIRTKKIKGYPWVEIQELPEKD